MKRDGIRRQLLKDFALAAKSAREEGDLDTWRIATTQWCRLATPGERKNAPGYLGVR
jgi:hypothetical protein